MLHFIYFFTGYLSDGNVCHQFLVNLLVIKLKRVIKELRFFDNPSGPK